MIICQNKINQEIETNIIGVALTLYFHYIMEKVVKNIDDINDYTNIINKSVWIDIFWILYSRN